MIRLGLCIAVTAIAVLNAGVLDWKLQSAQPQQVQTLYRIIDMRVAVPFGYFVRRWLAQGAPRTVVIPFKEFIGTPNTAIEFGHETNYTFPWYRFGTSDSSPIDAAAFQASFLFTGRNVIQIIGPADAGLEPARVSYVSSADALLMTSDDAFSITYIQRNPGGNDDKLAVVNFPIMELPYRTVGQFVGNTSLAINPFMAPPNSCEKDFIPGVACCAQVEIDVEGKFMFGGAFDEGRPNCTQPSGNPCKTCNTTQNTAFRCRTTAQYANAFTYDQAIIEFALTASNSN